MTINLTRGFSTQVDDEDYEFLNQWKWHYNKGYAERKEYKNGKQIHIRMHQVLHGIHADHINSDSLDNQKSNLRDSNHSTNAMNMRPRKGKDYKGVSREGKNWRTQIVYKGKRVFSAMFPTKIQAAMAYDLNAPEFFGEYFKPNFHDSLVNIADEPHG